MHSVQAWHHLLDSIERAWPVARWANVGVLVACSGGADSVCLLLALAELRHRASASSESSSRPTGFLSVAHFNHQVRGKEADRDATFVADLAHRLGLSVHVGNPSCFETESIDRTATPEATSSEQASRFAPAKTTSGGSSEASMRRDRHQFLIQTAHACGCRYVAMAHNADDNVETLLHNLMRGTGPSGMCGISPFRSFAQDLVLARPLLQVSRDAIREALGQRGQQWCEDATNHDDSYRRNWIRNQLIPTIKTRYPDATEAMTRAIRYQRQWSDIIERDARRWMDRVAIETGALIIPMDSQTPQAIVVSALQQLWNQMGWPRGAMGHEHWSRVADAIGCEKPDRFDLPGQITVVAHGNEIRVWRPRQHL